MQVSLEATGELQRRLTVQLPAERVEKEVENRLRSLAQRVRLDGFRPGKVPMKVIQQRYGARVREEVLDEVVQETLEEALRQENLLPAGGPRIESQQLIPGSSLEYTATFEVLPQIQLTDLADLELEKPVAAVTDADVDRVVEVLRTQRRTWERVDRSAHKGDQLVIDYTGTVDGREVAGGKAAGVAVELGADRLQESFEEALVGAKAGDNLSFDVTYPEEFPNREVAGRTVRYETTVHSVAEPRMPEVDEAFARAFGIREGGVDALRAEVRQNMERELERAVRARVKRQVMDALLERHTVTVPQTLVDEEVGRLVSQHEQDASKELPAGQEDLENTARQRVALGLIIAELVRANGITVDPARVRQTVEAIAASYETPDEVVKWYYGNRELLGGVESMVLEDQVVDWMMERVQAKEIPASFDEVVKSRTA